MCPEVSFKTLRKDLSRPSQKYQYLNKSKGRVKGKEILQRFLQSQYQVPKVVTDSDKESSSKSVSEPFSVGDDPNLKAETYKLVCEKLADEVTELTTTHCDVSDAPYSIIEEKEELNESLEFRDKQLENSKKNIKKNGKQGGILAGQMFETG